MFRFRANSYFFFLVVAITLVPVVVHGCADSSSSIFDAVSSAKNAAHQTAAEHEATQAKLRGLWNSACNTDQREYVALEVCLPLDLVLK